MWAENGNYGEFTNFSWWLLLAFGLEALRGHRAAKYKPVGSYHDHKLSAIQPSFGRASLVFISKCGQRMVIMGNSPTFPGGCCSRLASKHCAGTEPPSINQLGAIMTTNSQPYNPPSDVQASFLFRNVGREW